MAFNPSNSRNTRQTDTGGRDTRSATPTTAKGLTREEILERQRKLREAAERKRLAEQAAKNVGANARASAPVTQKDVLSFRDKNNYPAWYSRTQNTQNVYKPQTLDTVDGTIQVSSPSPGLTSRWSLGNEPGVTVDVAAELSGGGWYMPKWISTFYTLQTLGLLGLSADNPDAGASAADTRSDDPDVVDAEVKEVKKD